MSKNLVKHIVSRRHLVSTDSWHPVGGRHRYRLKGERPIYAEAMFESDNTGNSAARNGSGTSVAVGRPEAAS